MQQFIAVDLGTTNMKAALYDEALHCIATESYPMQYQRDSLHVEFDAEGCFDTLIALLGRLLKRENAQPHRVCGITLTGQAESLVVLDKSKTPLMNAISWMDERSVRECRELEAQFSRDTYSRHTGQQAVLPTWPATKIMWLRNHQPEVASRAACYALLKDYIVYRLTGNLLADCSIATFTFYFDIYKRRYWPDMLDVCGIAPSQLPPLAEPCTSAGKLHSHLAAHLGLSGGVHVNLGTLDHFAGMIGVGCTEEGAASLSIGTVMALAVPAAPDMPKDSGIAMHYGFLPGHHVMLPVAESGGICLEWFKNTCMPNDSFAAIDAVLEKRDPEQNDIVFLPYIAGTNAPELDAEVSGMFYGLRSRHDAYDMAYAVMEGVAFLLKKNCAFIGAAGTAISRITATGGGAKSALWCQLQADATGIPVEITGQNEAALLGTAMIGAVAAGVYSVYEEAAKTTVQVQRRFSPRASSRLTRKYQQFEALYEGMRAVRNL